MKWRCELLFKAVDSGYQVAISSHDGFAEQHYQTSAADGSIPNRRGSPKSICFQCRACEVVAGIASGKTDVVSSVRIVWLPKTHRFHNLGLVIIDEEQRFGVEIKERLKNVSNNVDVLTLSATPIPEHYTCLWWAYETFPIC